MTADDLVFISYAREDQSWAERLYMDLRKNEVNAWLDVRTLKAGVNWKLETNKAIRSARYFILLISRHSINKRGFVQREIKEALKVLAEFPKGETFLIPARLDKTEPIDEELGELNWVDLNPDYHDGLARILSALANLKPDPLVIAGPEASPTTPVQIRDRGRESILSMPLVLGDRAAISYAPFRTAKEFLQQFLDRLPSECIFSDDSLSYYITFDTRLPEVLLGDDLRAKYPEYITIVLQNAFRELEVRETGMSVILLFDGVERTLGIPYEAIRRIQIPEIGISIHVKPLG